MAETDRKLIPFSSRQTGQEFAAFHISDVRRENTIGRKLAEARREAGMSQKELASALNAYGSPISPAAISKWEKGDAIPNALQLFALCDIYGISDIREYFFGGLPESPAFSAELSQKGLNLLQAFKEMLIASGQYTPVSHRRMTGFAEQARSVKMPVSKYPVSAGTGNFLDEENFEETEFAASGVPEGADFGLRISGDSMEPIYTHRQIVWVERCEELDPGEVGIFIYDGSGYIKQYQEVMPPKSEEDEYRIGKVLYPKIYLVSFNKTYPPIPVNLSLGFQIVGRALN